MKLKLSICEFPDVRLGILDPGWTLLQLVVPDIRRVYSEKCDWKAECQLPSIPLHFYSELV